MVQLLIKIIEGENGAIRTEHLINDADATALELAASAYWQDHISNVSPPKGYLSKKVPRPPSKTTLSDN